MSELDELLAFLAPRYELPLSEVDLQFAYEGFCPYCGVRFEGPDPALSREDWEDMTFGEPDEPTQSSCSCCKAVFRLAKGEPAGVAVFHLDDGEEPCPHARRELAKKGLIRAEGER